jgi:hypothetical protein
MLYKYLKIFTISILFAGPISAAAAHDKESHFDKLPAELLVAIAEQMDLEDPKNLETLGRLGQASKLWRECTDKLLRPVIKRADLLSSQIGYYKKYMEFRCQLNKAIKNKESAAVIQRLSFLQAQRLMVHNHKNILSLAIEHENPVNVLRLLIKNKADVNFMSEDSTMSALHHAFYSRNIEAARLLINFGADIHAKDTGGNTVKDYAEVIREPVLRAELMEIFRLAEEKYNLAKLAAEETNKKAYRCLLQ